MKVLAIYAINQHLDELIEEARQNRLASAARHTRPSILRRALAAIRSSFTPSKTDSMPALAA